LFCTWRALINEARTLNGRGSRAKPLTLFDAAPNNNQRALIDPIAGQFVKIHFQAVKWRVDDYDSHKPKQATTFGMVGFPS